MKKLVTLLTITSIIGFQSHAQVTKGNWTIGGSARFSNDKTTFSTGESKSTQFNINPRIGYFIVNRFAIGVFGNFGNVTTRSSGTKASYTHYGIGPLFRYYFLPAKNTTNLLIEANGAYNAQKNNTVSAKSSFFSYDLLAGPVVYFNSSVGIEFLLGYGGYKERETNTKSNGINFNIGLQVHLDKD